MLIGELSEATGVSRDTIRYYVRMGLLEPSLGVKGGRNPYQIFSAHDLEFLRMLRVGQSFGMTLKDLTAVRRASGPQGPTGKARRAIVADRLEKLEAQAASLQTLIEKLRAELKRCEQ